MRLTEAPKSGPLGTWPLKGAFCADLRKEGLRAGAKVDPPGYCHFASWLDEGYFRQITAEYLAEETYRGRARKVWKLRASERDNRWLEARIYCMALAEHLGLSSLTPAEWAMLAKERGMPASDALALFRKPPDGSGDSPATTPGTDLDEVRRASERARFEKLMKENAERLMNIGRGKV